MAEQNAANTGTPAADSAPAVTPMFNASQLQSMAQHEIDKGALTREQAAEMLSVDGVQMKEQPTAEEAAYDALYPRAASIAEYEMPHAPDGLDPKLDRTAREWLFSAGFDRGRGSSLLKEADRVATQYSAMSESERKHYQAAERAKLASLWKDKTDEKIKLARGLVEELEAKSPGLMDILEAGPGNSAMVISLIAAQAEILFNRPRRK